MTYVNMLVACWWYNPVLSQGAVASSATCDVLPGLTDLFVKVSHSSINCFSKPEIICFLT